MGFSGRPSKGCLPCRQKRTKCDLALPACTQCQRKNRMCFGYRNEQDLVFRNETGLVIRKVKQKKQDSAGDDTNKTTMTASPSSDDSDRDMFANLDLTALVRHPSRRATLQDEAIMHWLANFNERFFSSSQKLESGFEYALPVYHGDLARGGPAVEIINACGLAALGNAKNAPELLREARVKQVKVLRQLNEQLQDPEYALSDSSVLTCLLLSSFENIMAEAESPSASGTHLAGAEALVKLRGASQFKGLVGHGMFVRLRGSLLVRALMTSEPFPAYLHTHLQEENLSSTDFEVVFHTLQSRVCAVRHAFKITGYLTPAMASEAHSILADFDAWNPGYPSWILPTTLRRVRTAVPAAAYSAASVIAHVGDKTHRFIWIGMSWLLEHIALILMHELLIQHYRTQSAQLPLSHSAAANPSAAAAALAAAHHAETQLTLASDVRDAVDFYLLTLEKSQASTRSIGAHMLLMPLNILLGVSSTTGEALAWIARTATRVSDIFACKQGKMMGDYLRRAGVTETGTGKERSASASASASSASSEVASSAGSSPAASSSSSYASGQERVAEVR